MSIKHIETELKSARDKVTSFKKTSIPERNNEFYDNLSSYEGYVYGLQKALELERLGEGWGLSRAGIADGAWLLAKVTAPASKLGKNQRTSDKAGYANPRVGASLIDRSCCLFYSSCEQ